MAAPTEIESLASVQTRPDGHSTVFFRGQLDAHSTPATFDSLRVSLADRTIRSVHIDASALESCDGAGMALLRYVAAGQLGSGAIASLTGLKPDLQRRFEQFSAEDYERFRPKPAPKPHMAEEVGIATDAVLRDLHEQVAFVGSVTAGMVDAFSHPKRMRWNEVKRVFELAGANALPIVALISLLA